MFCVYYLKNREPRSLSRTELKDKSIALVGICPICGMRMIKMVRSDKFKNSQSVLNLFPFLLFGKRVTHYHIREALFQRPFQGIITRVIGLFKFFFCPSWRRSYLLAMYMHEGLSAQTAMAMVGVVEFS